MTEFLDLSVPVGGSGTFIQLHQNGALQKVQPLWRKCFLLQKHLGDVNAKLRLCNELGWLFEFAKKCQQQEKDCEKEIRLLVDGLEKSKAWLEDQFEKLYSQLGAIDPSLVQPAHTLAGAQLPYGYQESSSAAGKSSIAVLKRNWVIETKSSLGSHELCKRFDAEEIPIPEPWRVRFSVDSWSSAYENEVCKKLIHKMISEARRNLRLR
jgi:hypothetical protein